MPGVSDTQWVRSTKTNNTIKNSSNGNVPTTIQKDNKTFYIE